MDQGGARFVFRKRITGLAVEDGQVKGVVDSDGQQLPADAVIVATGGSLIREQAAQAMGMRSLPRQATPSWNHCQHWFQSRPLKIGQAQ